VEKSTAFALAKDVEDFLREQVQADVATDPSELANDVLRCVRDQQRKPFENRGWGASLLRFAGWISLQA